MKQFPEIAYDMYIVGYCYPYENYSQTRNNWVKLATPATWQTCWCTTKSKATAFLFFCLELNLFFCCRAKYTTVTVLHCYCAAFCCDSGPTKRHIWKQPTPLLGVATCARRPLEATQSEGSELISWNCFGCCITSPTLTLQGTGQGLKWCEFHQSRPLRNNLCDKTVILLWLFAIAFSFKKHQTQEK